MRLLSSLLLSLLFCSTALAQNNWSVVTDSASFFPSNPVMSCSGSEHCVVVGLKNDGLYKPSVVGTSDGGSNWNTLNHGLDVTESAGSGGFGANVRLNAVQLLDPLHAVAVGGSGIVIRTEDGGATWNRLEGLTQFAISNVTFLGDKVGLIFVAIPTHGLILRSNDGGATWDTITPPGQHGYSDGRCITPTRYIALAELGSNAYFLTTDGGTTWAEDTLPLDADGLDLNTIISDIFFLDSLNGWMVGVQGLTSVPNDVVLHTSDGGLTWEKQLEEAVGGYTYSNGLLAVRFSDPMHGRAVGVQGKIISTSDGGVTWQLDVPNQEGLLQGGTLNDASFSGNEILAISRKGRFLRYQEGSVGVAERGDCSALMTISPSPASGRTRIELNGSHPDALAIIDALGREVMTFAEIPAGSTCVTFDAGTLTEGFYLLRWNSVGHTSSQPLLIRH